VIWGKTRRSGGTFLLNCGPQDIYCGPQHLETEAIQPAFNTSIAARNGSFSMFPEAILIIAPRIAARKKGGADSVLVIFRCFLFLERKNVFKDEILRFLDRKIERRKGEKKRREEEIGLINWFYYFLFF
jgi:hypothetical protein